MYRGYFNSLLLCFAVCAVVRTSLAKKLPSYITPCKLNDAGVSACIAAEMKKCLPRHARGIPELNIPPFDPMNIPSIELEHGGGTAVTFKATFKDLILVGIKDVAINDVNFDTKAVKFDLDLSFPTFDIESDYKIAGRILLVPFDGTGRFRGNCTNVNAKVYMTGEYETRNGKKYVKLYDDRVIKLTIGESKLHFDNLFRGNRELNDNTNQLLNENSHEIIGEVTPVIEEAVGGVVFGLIKRLLHEFAIEELFIVD